MTEIKTIDEVHKYAKEVAAKLPEDSFVIMVGRAEGKSFCVPGVGEQEGEVHLTVLIRNVAVMESFLGYYRQGIMKMSGMSKRTLNQLVFDLQLEHVIGENIHD